MMILGSHELTGKMETLKQPFCVLQKTKGNEWNNNNNTGTIAYTVQGVVTQKILFNQYPKVIMRAATAKTTGQ